MEDSLTVLRNRIAVFCAALLFLSALSFAEAAAFTRERQQSLIAELGDLSVTDVELRGKFKLDPERARELSGVSRGDPLSTLALEEIEQRYLKTGLFSEVELALDQREEAVFLVVTLQEKRTFIPVPLVYASSSTQMFGLFVIEANLFSTGATLVTGGFGSPDKQFAMFLVNYQIDKESPGFTFFSNLTRGEETTDFVEGSSYRSWKSLDSRVSADAAFPLSPKFGVTAGTEARISRLYDVSQSFAAPPDSLWISPVVGVYWSDKTRRLFYDSGLSASLDFRHGFPVEGESQWNSARANLAAGIKLPKETAFQILAAGEFSDRPPSAETELTRLQLLQGITLRSDKWIAGRASIDYPFAQTSWGIFTAGAFYESGFASQGLEGEKEGGFFHGPGAAFTIFLRKVAVPAVGISAGWNAAASRLAFSAAVGMQM